MTKRTDTERLLAGIPEAAELLEKFDELRQRAELAEARLAMADGDKERLEFLEALIADGLFGGNVALAEEVARVGLRAVCDRLMGKLDAAIEAQEAQQGREVKG